MKSPNELQTLQDDVATATTIGKKASLDYITHQLQEWVKKGIITIPSGMPPEKFVEGWYLIPADIFDEAARTGWRNQW